ncbi:MAG: cell wall hydrolase [Lachnospiraceae bacterium]|nr:cell wall hydrolase [Lachnospiraceae bacterium]
MKKNTRLFRVLTKRLVSCFMALSISMTTPYFACIADEYDDKIETMKGNEAKTKELISDLEKETSQTKEAIALLQEQREASEDNISELKSQSSELQGTVEEYSNQLDQLSGEIAQAENTMSEISKEIVELNDELSKMQEERAEKYALLKSRMKTVYEKGGTKGMLQLVFEASSFKDLLSRTEYLKAVINYDQNKIAECRALEEKLQEKIKEVEAKEEELNVYQRELDSKYGEIENISNQVMGELRSTNNSLSIEENKMENYEEQMAGLDQKMKSIEAKTAAAQAELARQIAERLAMKKEDTSGSYSASGSELEWLAATIQAEADGESYTGKLAVGSVIMNRVKSSAFPNNVIGVIQQSMQFASYRSGKVELIIARGPNSTCIKAANEVLGGARVGDYLFFMTKYYADYYGISEYTMIGNHAFFYRWITKEKTVEPEAESEAKDQASEGETGEENKEENKEESPENTDNGENTEGEGESGDSENTDEGGDFSDAPPS